jgi:excinuclease ABC subunit B
MFVNVELGEEFPRQELLKKLVDIQYERNNVDLARGKFRVRGDIVEVFPAYKETAIRIEFFGGKYTKMSIRIYLCLFPSGQSLYI